jgi:hypothetical protein
MDLIDFQREEGKGEVQFERENCIKLREFLVRLG